MCIEVISLSCVCVCVCDVVGRRGTGERGGGGEREGA